jgi:hypothetical protein
MGKVFITDEVNDMYTADVTNAGKIKVEDGASLFKVLSSAQTITSAQGIVCAACYVKSVILGRYPATAASLHLFDTDPNNATGLEGYSALGTTGDHHVVQLAFPVGFASGQTCAVTNPVTDITPCTIPINVYCASGLVAVISSSANMADGFVGAMENVTIVYQT